MGRDETEFLKLREASADWLEPWEPRLAGDRSPIDDGAFKRLMLSADTEVSKRFLVCVRESGAIIGQISINNIVRGAFQSGALGYWLGRTFTGRGLMSEALGLVVTHAFGVLGLHRVEANIIPRNEPSRALVRRAGFRYEGTAARYLQIAGVWEDHERWGVTREEWNPARVTPSAKGVAPRDGRSRPGAGERTGGLRPRREPKPRDRK